MAVKYSTSPINNTIKTNSIVLGNGTGDYGPTESSGFWSKITPPMKGYVIYTVSEARPEPSIVVAYNDEEAIHIATYCGGTNIATIQDALIYFLTGSTGTTIVNMDFPRVVASDTVVTLDTGFVASYPKGGSIWKDLSGNNNHGILSGTTFNLKKGGIFDFNGSNYITIPHTADLSLNTTTVKTIQVWIKFNEITNDAIIFNKVSSSYGYDGYSLRLYTGGALRSITIGESTEHDGISLSGCVTTGIWYLITFQSVINNTAGSTKVFVNSTQVISTQHGTNTYSESNNLVIGSVAGASDVGGVNLNGSVSAFYFYNRELSIQEIQQNYNATRSRFESLPGFFAISNIKTCAIMSDADYPYSLETQIGIINNLRL